MNKRTIIIISLVSAVISLIHLLAVYYGWDRWFWLNRGGTESYVAAYPQLDPATDGRRVVISLTADKESLANLKPVLLSLLDQTVRVDEIAVRLRYGLRVPAYMQDIAQIYRYAIPYGEVGCFVPAVLRERDAKTVIIMVRGNKLYGKDFVERILAASDERPGKAIKMGGTEEEPDAILVTPAMFDERVSKYDGKSSCCLWLDKTLRRGVEVVEYSGNL